MSAPTVTYLADLFAAQYNALDADGRDADVAAVIAAARTVHVDGGELDELQRWNVTRILGRDARAVLADVGDELAAVDRFESCTDRGDLLELIDGDAGPDWVATAEAEAARYRSSALATARKALQG